ncbi:MULTISPECIES: hypothetical protein [Chitinophagaceae]
MNNTLLIQLIDTLSNKEVALFRKGNKIKDGQEIYMILLDIIMKSKNKDWDEIRDKFYAKCRGASLENATNYLYNCLLDMLVNDKLKKEKHYEAMYNLSKIKVLNERNLNRAAMTASNALYKQYTDSDDLILKYLIIRNQLHFLSAQGFDHLDEKQLVAVQEKGKETLKALRSNHEHHTLYELLKYRIIHQAEKPHNLNDLILNELAIIGQNPQKSVEAQKVHLLFQSFYFSTVKEYNAAIKTFFLLNELFERKITINSQNIFDYFLTLDGILHTLRYMEKLSEMPYFIDKLHTTLLYKTPEYFTFLVKKTIVIYQLHYHNATQNKKGALAFVAQIDKDTLNKYSLIDNIKQSELIFYISLSYYNNNNLAKAVRLLGKIDVNKYRTDNHPIYKVSKLFSLVLHFEQRDLVFLEYEIRSYIRNAKGIDHLNDLEKKLFKFFRQNHTLTNGRKKGETLDEPHQFVSVLPKYNDSYSFLNPYFNFLAWLSHKSGQPYR